jgi:hypothetical protein
MMHLFNFAIGLTAIVLSVLAIGAVSFLAGVLVKILVPSLPKEIGTAETIIHGMLIILIAGFIITISMAVGEVIQFNLKH